MVLLMARPTDRIATDTGGWTEPLPITRDDASAIFGLEVPQAVWAQIEEVYLSFRANLAALDATASSFHQKVGGLDRLLEDVEAALRDVGVDPGVLDGLASSVERETGKRDFGGAVRQAIADSRAANDRLRAVLAYATNPALLPYRSDAEVKVAVARKLKDILAAAGLSPRLTWSEELERPGGVSEADLTAFERLTAELKLHEARTPAAHAKWLQRALKTNSPSGAD